MVARPEVGGSVRVEILNGCGEAGVARRARAYLRGKGYDVLAIGDAKGHFAQTLVVERRSPMNANARLLARVLQLDENDVTQSLDTLSPVWVTLIIGDDYGKYLPDTVETIQ
ncbi:MAG: LytR C-terminal domain-containing protein [candidate division WOR-3 bacterium]|nr:LytR C-terminal domain-containing protein [candidate division WOR-3 bacterium]